MMNENVIFRFYGPMGVQVDVDMSLLWLFGIYAFFLLDSDPLYAVMFPVAVILAIFLHEMGHAWGNLVQGIPVRRVMLFGGGGFCESARSATPYQRELTVAMGPIVNAVLWAVCGLIHTWITQGWYESGYQPGLVLSETVYFLWLFSYINLLLLIFNMIPVQPLDGGKLLHLMMSRILHHDSAQFITGAIGLALSIVWIPAMIVAYYFEGWVLFFIPSIIAHYRMMRGEPAY